jgi:hypothetical protein
MAAEDAKARRAQAIARELLGLEPDSPKGRSRWSELKEELDKDPVLWDLVDRELAARQGQGRRSGASR